MSSEPGNRATVRILHHMARTGGTIISRCLASMDRVVLLSEIHPLGMSMFDPLIQAHKWYGLLNEQDRARARRGDMSFRAAIELIATRCRQQDRVLVLRDWSHLDFTGFPFAQPVYHSRLVASLEDYFDLRRFATVRHPLDQWLSLSGQPRFRNRLDPEQYLHGVSRFAEMAVTVGHVRYEDFADDSDTALNAICAALEIPFDASYRQKWSRYTNITGDTVPGRADNSRIGPLPRKPVSAEEASRLRNMQAYQQILQTLGYPQQQAS